MNSKTLSLPGFHACTLHKQLLFIALLLLSACGSQTVKDEVDTTLIDSVVYSQAEASELDSQAQQYLQEALSNQGAERERLLLKSAQLFYLSGDPGTAKQTLAKMRPDPFNINAKLLAAKIALSENNPKEAIALLPDSRILNQSQQTQVQIILADIDLALGYAMESVARRVKLEPLLKTTQAKHKNNQQIWSALSGMSSTALYNQTTDDEHIAAWLDLARIMRGFSTKGRISTGNVETAVLDWATRHPQNSVSNEFLSRLIDEYISTAQSVTSIAVLLPQQGKFSAASETIKNGLLSAYYADEQRPVLHFYDTSNGPLSKHIQQAIDDGASNIIGPLNKTLINELSKGNNLDIPVLTLNYAGNSTATVDNLYQFGLSPEDEARQVAELAIRQGKLKAVVLAPDSDWGRRLQNAFTQYYEELGGIVVNTQDYSNSSADYSRPIKRMLNLDNSAIRHRRIEDRLGKKLEFEPYRRQDVDMVFIAATSHAARGIIPAIKFHHASELPVYATSHVYAGTADKGRNADLNGLLFCDMPWVLETDIIETANLKTGQRRNSQTKADMTRKTDGETDKQATNTISANIGNTRSLKKTFQSNWPEQQRYTRLFALGVDAYHLVYNLEYLAANPYTRFSGTTGNIHLDENKRIVRNLLWAKFIRGKAVLIQPELKFDLPVIETADASDQNTAVSPPPLTPGP